MQVDQKGLHHLFACAGGAGALHGEAAPDRTDKRSCGPAGGEQPKVRACRRGLRETPPQPRDSDSPHAASTAVLSRVGGREEGRTKGRTGGRHPHAASKQPFVSAAAAWDAKQGRPFSGWEQQLVSQIGALDNAPRRVRSRPVPRAAAAARGPAQPVVQEEAHVIGVAGGARGVPFECRAAVYTTLGFLCRPCSPRRQDATKEMACGRSGHGCIISSVPWEDHTVASHVLPRSGRVHDFRFHVLRILATSKGRFSRLVGWSLGQHYAGLYNRNPCDPSACGHIHGRGGRRRCRRRCASAAAWSVAPPLRKTDLHRRHCLDTALTRWRHHVPSTHPHIRMRPHQPPTAPQLPQPLPPG